MKWIAGVLVLAVSVQVSQAQWSDADEEALKKMLAAKAQRGRRAGNSPGITTADGDVLIVAGAGGSHIGFEIDGTRVNIDEMPEGMRDYTDASAQVLQVGYNIGKGSESIATTVNNLLTKIDEGIGADIKEVQSDVAALGGLKDAVATSLSSSEEKTSQMITDAKVEIAASTKTQLDTQKESVAANTEYVAKAKECAKEGKGVAVVSNKMVCVETKPTADKDAKCEDKNQGKLSVREFTSGTNKLKGVYICVDELWVKLHTFVTKEQRELGSTQAKRATSCKQILGGNPEAKTGKYWVKQDNGAVWNVICHMDATYRGGGWQLLMTSMHPRDMIGGSNHPMGSVNINQDAPTLTGKYTRNLVNVVKPAIGDEFMILQKEGKWKTFIMTHTFCGFNSRDSGVCNGCHGTYAKGQIYNEDNSKVNCGGAGCWFNSCTVCGGCNAQGCDTIAFNADHGDYAAFYGGGVWKLFGSGWTGQCTSGWDRKKYDIHPINVFWRTKA